MRDTTNTTNTTNGQPEAVNVDLTAAQREALPVIAHGDEAPTLAQATAEAYALLRMMGLKVSGQYAGPRVAPWGQQADGWTIKLQRSADGHVDEWRTMYYTGLGKRRKVKGVLSPVIPSPFEVLACLLREADSGEMELRDFRAEFGYDGDAEGLRESRECWKGCRRVLVGIARLLAPFERERLQEVLADW